MDILVAIIDWLHADGLSIERLADENLCAVPKRKFHPDKRALPSCWRRTPAPESDPDRFAANSCAKGPTKVSDG